MKQNEFEQTLNNSLIHFFNPLLYVILSIQQCFSSLIIAHFIQQIL